MTCLTTLNWLIWKNYFIHVLVIKVFGCFESSFELVFFWKDHMKETISTSCSWSFHNKCRLWRSNITDQQHQQTKLRSHVSVSVPHLCSTLPVSLARRPTSPSDTGGFLPCLQGEVTGHRTCQLLANEIIGKLTKLISNSFSSLTSS